MNSMLCVGRLGTYVHKKRKREREKKEADDENDPLIGGASIFESAMSAVPVCS